mmetsp:Transcript_46290/g.108642  ORF Transcript_46290/g.108642 Transcript_46290/m.108642 type:complete len:206 (+) Transcript_46290:225-842(+)
MHLTLSRMRALVLIGALCTCTCWLAASASSAPASATSTSRANRSPPPSRSLSSLRLGLPQDPSDVRRAGPRRGDRARRRVRGLKVRVRSCSRSLARSRCSLSCSGWSSYPSSPRVTLASCPCSTFPASRSASCGGNGFWLRRPDARNELEPDCALLARSDVALGPDCPRLTCTHCRAANASSARTRASSSRSHLHRSCNSDGFTS